MAGISFESEIEPGFFYVCLVNQPGFLPALIRFYSRSHWNHVGIYDPNGYLFDLDRPGVQRIDIRNYTRLNEVRVTSIRVDRNTALENIQRMSQWPYRDRTNFILMFFRYWERFFFPKHRELEFDHREGSNCVGFCLRTLGWPVRFEQCLIPSDFESQERLEAALGKVGLEVPNN